MKLYVVSKGCYSDYNILKIFENEEKAEKFVELYNLTDTWDEAEIEYWETDDDSIDIKQDKIYLQLNYYIKSNSLYINKLIEKGKNKLSEDETILMLSLEKNISNAKVINKEKYLKIAQDKYVELKSLIDFEGYTIEMINELLNKGEMVLL